MWSVSEPFVVCVVLQWRNLSELTEAPRKKWHNSDIGDDDNDDDDDDDDDVDDDAVVVVASQLNRHYNESTLRYISDWWSVFTR